MSNVDSDAGYSFGQIVLAAFVGIVGFILFYLLVAKVFGVTDTIEVAEPAAAISKIEENIKPVASVEVAAAGAGAGAEKSGEEVYKAVCSMCHAAGLMNAPKFGDKAQWEARIKQGQDTLVTNAVKGIRAMPAKGGNPSLSDAEVAGAVKYMANAAGAKF